MTSLTGSPCDDSILISIHAYLIHFQYILSSPQSSNLANSQLVTETPDPHVRTPHPLPNSHDENNIHNDKHMSKLRRRREPFCLMCSHIWFHTSHLWGTD
jgi:hypothetical protein